MLKRFLRLQSLCLWLPAGLWLLVLAQSPVIGADAKSAAGASAKPVATATPVPSNQPAPKQVYTAKCSFCHDPKPASVRPDLKAWMSLIYTSGCPEVTIKLDEPQRRAIKAFMEAELKAATL